ARGEVTEWTVLGLARRYRDRTGGQTSLIHLASTLIIQCDGTAAGGDALLRTQTRQRDDTWRTREASMHRRGTEARRKALSAKAYRTPPSRTCAAFSPAP